MTTHSHCNWTNEGGSRQSRNYSLLATWEPTFAFHLLLLLVDDRLPGSCSEYTIKSPLMGLYLATAKEESTQLAEHYFAVLDK